MHVIARMSDATSNLYCMPMSISVHLCSPLIELLVRLDQERRGVFRTQTFLPQHPQAEEEAVNQIVLFLCLFVAVVTAACFSLFHRLVFPVALVISSYRAGDHCFFSGRGRGAVANSFKC